MLMQQLAAPAVGRAGEQLSDGLARAGAVQRVLAAQPIAAPLIKPPQILEWEAPVCVNM